VGIASSIFPPHPARGQSGHHRPAQRHARGLFLGTVRPGGRPPAAGIGAVWHDGDPCFTSGPGTCKARNLASNPNLHDLSQASRHGSDPRRRGGASHRASDLASGGQHLPRHRLAGRGSGGRVHRALQRAQRWPAAVAFLPVHLPHRHRVWAPPSRTARHAGGSADHGTFARYARAGPQSWGDTHPPPAGRSTWTPAAKAIWPGGPSAATGICHCRSTLTHRTVAYRPGKVSEVLTEHYRRAHPEALGLPSR